MLPVSFPAETKSIILLTPPEGVSEEQCNKLTALKQVIENTPCFQVAFKPKREDLQAMQEGRPVFVQLTTDKGRWLRISPLQQVTTGTMFCNAVTGWLPSQAEVRLLKRGSYVWITLIGVDFPPIRVWTLDKEGQPNE